MHTSYREQSCSVNLDQKCNLYYQSKDTSTTDSSITNSIHPGGKTRITCPPQVVKGLDFLKVSLWLEWHSNSLLNELQALKTVVQSGDDNCITFHAPGGFDWNLHRTGTSRYNFRLTTGDITLLLNKRRSDGVVPTARLEIGSLSCWSPGFFTIYERIVLWLKALDATIIREQVSEVHMTADFVGCDIKSLGIEDENRWVSRVHKFDIHNDRRQLSGISLGKGDIMLRIYDKVLELKKSPHKQAVFSEIWSTDAYNQHPVTRVEFQLRRTVLKEFENKIETVKNLLFGLNSIWQYCTKSWSRFCKNSINRNHNQSKSENSEFWNKVSSIKWTGNQPIERKKRRQNKNLDQIRANIRGMAMTATSFYDVHPEDLDHIIGLSQKILEEDLTKLYKDDPYKFIEQMKRKSNEIYVNI